MLAFLMTMRESLSEPRRIEVENEWVKRCKPASPRRDLEEGSH